MRYYKRTNEFKASNVLFDVDQCQAWSYGWWRFVHRINGKVFFNNYRYSNATRRHQSKIRNLLSELGIEIDYVGETRDAFFTPEKCLEYYKGRVDELRSLILKPRTHKKKNAERQELIIGYLHKIYHLTLDFPELKESEV